jgi:hypothetical protein
VDVVISTELDHELEIGPLEDTELGTPHEELGTELGMTELTELGVD